MSRNKPIIRMAEVKSVVDDQAGLRIKVRLHEDNYKKYPTDEDLPFCFPLLPKHIHLNPKVGECVLIILASLDNASDNRFFIGPLISQQYGLNYEPYYYRSRSLLEGGNITTPHPKPEMNPDNIGSYPNREDVALQGRQNADLILRDNEVRLRCGFKRYPYLNDENSLKFNERDMAYIQLRHDVFSGITTHNGVSYHGFINIVADSINLLSRHSKNEFNLYKNEESDTYKINDKRTISNDKTTDKLINNVSQYKILNEAHPLIYGDELVDWLKKLIEVIRTHTHPFAMDPPCFTTPQHDVLKTNLNDMLSQAVRIN